ncbi:UV damage repair endonuclease [Fervidicella metallireducens AeB]|uniref:UV damage repair endonuclease n=1 Tax=Fervidicella metallireducens AeB TaxID=1403537 RepID=A0A017RXG5_9CLOT|nr:UV DNA damage repair endonuclease UvsE [Fervidicella metallireducens]EYE89064.1 UV damage repair endonuclease [Fervidicella metallireducens AeB]
MKINFGYVAISMKLKDASPNRTITLKSLSKIEKSLWKNKLREIAQKNIENTMRIIRYNSAYGIKLYRMTSKIVPLATHDELRDWNWQEELSKEFYELGLCIKENNIRVSTHPDHYTLLNSPKEEVLKSSIKDLDYHCKMFELMDLGYEAKMVIHVGGSYNNKSESIKRFYENYSNLDENIRKRIILENDDKIFNAQDVLKICKDLKIPMVLDVHHHICNQGNVKLEEIIGDIFDTWNGEIYVPKIHLSSPKSDRDIRSHHDFIDVKNFLDFINTIRFIKCDFDVMVEAKMKDIAVFKLMEDLYGIEYIKK